MHATTPEHPRHLAPHPRRQCVAHLVERHVADSAEVIAPDVRSHVATAQAQLLHDSRDVPGA